MRSTTSQKAALKRTPLTEAKNKILQLQEVIKQQNLIIDVKTETIETARGINQLMENRINELEGKVAKLNMKTELPVNEFNPCSVCRERCPFGEKLTQKQKKAVCHHAYELEVKYNDAIKYLNNSIHLPGNKHLYSWLTKSVEIPEQHEDWIISLSSHLKKHCN